MKHKPAWPVLVILTAALPSSSVPIRPCQELRAEPLCWYAGAAYSIGTLFRVPDGRTFRCRPGKRWFADEPGESHAVAEEVSGKPGERE